MGTLRQDATTNEWVILAPDRATRPDHGHGSGSAAVRGPLPARDPGCPFCPGNEHQTPPEVLRSPVDGPWERRVVPNRYPALAPDGQTNRRGDPPAREMDGVGYHEVVVESPQHDERLDEMPLDRLTGVVTTWRDRYRTLAADPRIKAVVVFKNFGERAGTSLVHPHSQIVATPVIPPDALRRYAVATRYFDDTGRCVYLDLLDHELESGERVVAERDGLVAVAPFASRVPYETWITPRASRPSFASLGDAEVREMADLLRDVVAAIRHGAGDPDYNLVIHSAPAGEESKPFFVWHLRVLPRIVTPAGFELGSGMSINCVAPEAAAIRLRETLARVPAH
ncbi:MAG: galactose-1-phosphate uridylyltransferase [Actinomycetota bacterium]